MDHMPRSVSYQANAPTLAITWLAAFTIAALAWPAPSASAQGQSVAGGQRIAVQTARHGWLDGTFQDIRGDTVVLEHSRTTTQIEIPNDSVLAWRVPADGRRGRTIRGAVLGGIAGAMAGAGVGFEGATKVTAPREMRRASLRFGLAGTVIGSVIGARPQWREVTVVLARGGPGEQLLVMRDASMSVDDYQVGGATATSSTQRQLITRSELETVQAATAFDAIRRLRPHFLSARRAEIGRQALVMPVVYLDGQRLGELRTLEQIQLRVVLEIQYYSPTEASMRWGLGHDGGVIHVVLRRA